MTISRRLLLQRLGLGAAALPLGACGSILYPERRGQQSGRIDAGVAVLDGIGLLLFLIPGIIAYAVDFHTGAIYLPGTGASLETEDDLAAVPFEGPLTDEKMDEVWEAQYGRERPFRNAELQSRPITNLAELKREVRLARNGEGRRFG
ncbi:polyribonucleotide nucleotidyltransferase [Parvularcula marina]|uniref:polyribonucleotide nucleotidyltransferase n=1 Tax=Parvularcula marina TaxID=2292771 RepID=UPI003515A08D